MSDFTGSGVLPSASQLGMHSLSRVGMDETPQTSGGRARSMEEGFTVTAKAFTIGFHHGQTPPLTS